MPQWLLISRTNFYNRYDSYIYIPVIFNNDGQDDKSTMDNPTMHPKKKFNLQILQTQYNFRPTFFNNSIFNSIFNNNPIYLHHRKTTTSNSNAKIQIPFQTTLQEIFFKWCRNTTKNSNFQKTKKQSKARISWTKSKLKLLDLYILTNQNSLLPFINN